MCTTWSEFNMTKSQAKAIVSSLTANNPTIQVKPRRGRRMRKALKSCLCTISTQYLQHNLSRMKFITTIKINTHLPLKFYIDSQCQKHCFSFSFICFELLLSGIAIELEQTSHHKCQKNSIHLSSCGVKAVNLGHCKTLQ